jgi:hypothetical protein
VLIILLDDVGFGASSAFDGPIQTPTAGVFNTPHYGINEGKVPAGIIVFYAGAVDTPVPVIQAR